jgi:hypothetical protein
MKYRTLFYAFVVLFALGMTLLLFQTRDQESPRVFSAAVSRDCAPSDGPAFTVSIPHDSGSVIRVSIWQSPDIRLPVSYEFPGGKGNATYQPQFGPREQLSGRVFLRHVEAGAPVSGAFTLRTAGGEVFEGEFEAAWTGTMIACG